MGSTFSFHSAVSRTGQSSLSLSITVDMPVLVEVETVVVVVVSVDLSSGSLFGDVVDVNSFSWMINSSS